MNLISILPIVVAGLIIMEIVSGPVPRPLSWTVKWFIKKLKQREIIQDG